MSESKLHDALKHVPDDGARRHTEGAKNLTTEASDSLNTSQGWKKYLDGLKADFDKTNANLPPLDFTGHDGPLKGQHLKIVNPDTFEVALVPDERKPKLPDVNASYSAEKSLKEPVAQGGKDATQHKPSPAADTAKDETVLFPDGPAVTYNGKQHDFAHATKIEYPNGVKLEHIKRDHNGNIVACDMTLPGKHYVKYDKDGKLTGDVIHDITMQKDGGLLIHGTFAHLGEAKGRTIVIDKNGFTKES